MATRHDGPGRASPWVVAHLPEAKAGATALDLAAGAGRHSRLLLERGYRVTALDRDLSGLAPDVATDNNLAARVVDIEAPEFRLPLETFDVVVVTNYLHRPVLAAIAGAIKPGGHVIYETFADGNQRLGKPRNPDFLLQPGELLDAFAGFFWLAYEDVIETAACPDVEKPAARQRLFARKP